jgi:NADPH:quinone reductase-like Zn-dependent oxidoreductase
MPTPTLPALMTAVLTTGHGGHEVLEYRSDVPRPEPKSDEVLIRVGAAGVNNTDINTRIGWYSKSVNAATSEASANASDDGGWNGVPLAFPLIQGADICGRIVAVGAGVDTARIGERVIVPTMQPAPNGGPFDIVTVGSEMNGGFGQYVTMRASQAYPVNSAHNDVEWASFPCAYSTAENLLHRAGVRKGDVVLITGASGGVGSAAVQLAKRRGATIMAQVGGHKAAAILALGAERTLSRGDDPVKALGANSVDVVIDIVGGPQFAALLAVLRPGGRYAVSGAIAGPIVSLDLRTLYLKDHSFFGCTAQHPDVFPNLIGYVERGEIRPLVALTFPLAEIVAAQQAFESKNHVGKIVLVPPQE